MNKKNKFNASRRKFLASAGLLSVAGLCPFPVLSQNENVETPDILSIIKAEPYLRCSGMNKITVSWITNKPCLSWVEFGENANNLSQKAKTVNAGLVEAFNTIHVITLQNLKPGTNYYYRIHSKVIETFDPYNVVFGETYTSKVYSIDTINPSNDAVSFLVLNDMHDRPESISHLLQYQTPGKKDFILLNGDLFGHLRDEEQIITNLLNPLAEISSDTPIVLSRGNHETRGKFARQLNKYFNHEKQGYYFSFSIGSSYFIVLDSGEDKTDDDKEYFGLVDFDSYRIEQSEWLKKEVAKKEFKKAKFKVVISHIPLFYSGDAHGTLHCRKVWADLLNKAGIDIMICGHTHVSGIHPKVKGLHNYPIVIGGGSKDGTRTLIEAKIDTNYFQIKIIADSGELKDELKIKAS